ncbi:MAG: ion transporter [Okeania sp. SIO2C2]|uniref:ion transporter n=1 Tax=Okeania sp. SIO2C2 TaxID=2607787 RepID=UPI0013B608B9|nr:ion transporter [Okeania sp. SIO2C2]NEP87384.1 ion transporter [Okeania sp. SIO2C2]
MMKIEKRRKSLKEQIYYIFEYSDQKNILSLLDDLLITILTSISVSAFILETSPRFSDIYSKDLELVEIMITVLFTLEYIIRIWVCTINPKYRHPIGGRLKYIITPLSVIDFIAILPFYLQVLFPGLGFIRFTLLLRLFRLFKISRYSESLRTILKVIVLKKEELIATLLVVIFVLVFASSLMFFAENEAQPEKFSSILETMWWGVVTLTTVGYGDVYPTTHVGKLLSAAMAFLGIGIFALPAGIISSGFAEEVQKRRGKKIVHPVGKDIKITAETTFPLNSDFRHHIHPDFRHHHPKQEQKQVIVNYIEESSEIMKICIETAKKKYGHHFKNEEIIKDFALLLYQETMHKFHR